MSFSHVLLSAGSVPFSVQGFPGRIELPGLTSHVKVLEGLAAKTQQLNRPLLHLSNSAKLP